MDAFYASVEQRDNPQLRGLPTIVGGDPRGRGVVTSASYEARKFGIHSAMASSQAKKMCPDGIFVYPRFDAYREASRNIMAIFHEFSELVEPMSLDEAYLDITAEVEGGKDPVDIASVIIETIKDRTKLDASAGVSFNKFLAKVGSGINKPRGIKVIPPGEADDFLDDLPIRKFHGVGKATEKKMIDVGILTGRDLRSYSREELVSLFGRSGIYYHDIIHNLYDSPVSNTHERRSIGKERTFHEDTNDIDVMLEKLTSIAGMLGSAMEKRMMMGRTITLKVKYSDHTRITRSFTLPFPTRSPDTMMDHILDLLSRTEAGDRPVRLVGMSMSNLEVGGEGHDPYFQSTLDRWILEWNPPLEHLAQ